MKRIRSYSSVGLFSNRIVIQSTKQLDQLNKLGGTINGNIYCCIYKTGTFCNNNLMGYLHLIPELPMSRTSISKGGN
jgi:hypothetical protein